MYEGKLQNWQLDNNSSSSLTSKVCYDVAQAINNEPELADGLKSFVQTLKCKVMVSGKIEWDECPDESFMVIWKHKQQCLLDLYQMITNVYSCHIPNTYFSDMYHEKYEQALDVSIDNSAPAPLLGKNKTLSVGDSVLVQRSKWGGLLKLLEDYRVEAKDRIIKAPTIAKATSALEIVMNKLLEEIST